MSQFEKARGQYTISTDPNRVDVAAAHAYLSRSYWAEGIPEALLAKAIAGSLCFALRDDRNQIGFARVVTDRATFAYLCDVYVLEEFRGHGLGQWLIEEVVAHPDLQGLRRFVLVTRDAHGLYEHFAFRPLKKPDGYMEIISPNVYKREGG